MASPVGRICCVGRLALKRPETPAVYSGCENTRSARPRGGGGHGPSGGMLKQLIDEVIVAALGRPGDGVLNDSAALYLAPGTRAAGPVLRRR